MSAMQGEGEEQALLKSPFEDGLKSARIEPALREHLLALPGFVLRDGGGLTLSPPRDGAL